MGDIRMVELDSFSTIDISDTDVSVQKESHSHLSTKLEEVELESENEVNQAVEKGGIRYRIRNHIRALFSMFMFYFLFTICLWGSADFLLSYLATRNSALSSGDTLAFISIGNLIGTCVARFILSKWKTTSWGKYIFEETETVLLPIKEDTSIEVKKLNKFQKIRILIRKPKFLDDAFQLSFLSGVIGSVAPLGYYELSIGGGEASTVAPLISLYVIVPTILGLFVLKERKSIVKFAGILCAIAAVVLFALGGGAKHWSLLNLENMGFFSLGFFGWGISYFIRGIAASKVVDFEHLLLMATSGLMFGNYMLIIFVFGVSPFKLTEAHVLTMAAGSLQVLGDLGFFLLSKEGKESSKVVPLTGTYILVPSLLGFIFLKDSVTLIKVGAIMLSMLALGLLGAA